MMTFIAAFDQLAIQFELLNQLILISFGDLALGVGLSVGLGGRDVAGGIMSGYYVRQRMRSGDTVSVAGIQGVVREVGPVATVIETTDGGLTHRHTVPNARMLSEAVRQDAATDTTSRRCPGISSRTPGQLSFPAASLLLGTRFFGSRLLL